MANKVPIATNAFLYPMPVVLVGAEVEGKPNYMAVAWITRVNYQPPLVAIGIGKRQYTARGIQAHGEFGVSVPSRGQAAATDYVGMVSGRDVDKSKVFDSFYGSLAHAPMARACPLTMACRLVQTVDLPSNLLFIGEIVEAYAEERVLSAGTPDIQKLQPIGLTMPDNQYWAVGETLGPAWSLGKEYKPLGS
jgi:flavin reductase (DIM6/NTAB) family NADH-FMN oxidoreductase RutF